MTFLLTVSNHNRLYGPSALPSLNPHRPTEQQARRGGLHRGRSRLTDQELLGSGAAGTAATPRMKPAIPRKKRQSSGDYIHPSGTSYDRALAGRFGVEKPYD